MKIEIEILNAVECRIERQHAKYIVPAISFQRSYWQQTPRGKRQKFYDYVFWTKKGQKHFHFLTGHLSKVLSYCQKHNIEIKITGNKPSDSVPNLPIISSAHLDGITFRPNQLDAIKTAISKKRGVIKKPTRTGKTIIQYGICSGARMNVLFLAHTLDLVKQLADVGRRFNFNVHEVHGQRRDLYWKHSNSNIVCMTRTSANNLFKKEENKWMSTFFDAVIVDEVHHITKADGQYANILKFIQAPLRFGFTATMPENNVEAMFCIHGFIGPIIYDLSINEAVEKNLLIKPVVKLIKAPVKKIPIATKYQEVYDRAIVDNHERHDLIAEKAREFSSQGLSVLILVNRLDHGAYQQYAFEKISMNVPFLHGETNTEEREKIKQGLIDKKILCCIVSTIWKEGVNIPTLDVCINAAGGVSEIATLQGVGRSLTKVEGKTQAVIMDVFDQSHHHLIRHFGERISLYMKNSWL